MALLGLSHNDLESLPVEIGNVSTLVQVHLNRNKLKNLPDSLCDLNELKIFVTDDNCDLDERFDVHLNTRSEVEELLAVLRSRRDLKRQREVLYDKIFNRVDVNGDGTLQKEEIASLLDISGLEKEICGEIWEKLLTLNQNSHCMSLDMFRACMGMISQAQNQCLIDVDLISDEDALPVFPDLDKLNPFKRNSLFGGSVQEELLEQRLLQLELMHDSSQKELELKLADLQREELEGMQRRQQDLEQELKVCRNSRTESKVNVITLTFPFFSLMIIFI